MLREDRPHEGREPGNAGHRLLEEPAPLLLNEVGRQVIPQVADRRDQIGPSGIGGRPGGREMLPHRLHETEEIPVLGEHVSEDHRIGTVDGGHREILLEHVLERVAGTGLP